MSPGSRDIVSPSVSYQFTWKICFAPLRNEKIPADLDPANCSNISCECANKFLFTTTDGDLSKVIKITQCIIDGAWGL